MKIQRKKDESQKKKLSKMNKKNVNKKFKWKNNERRERIKRMKNKVDRAPLYTKEIKTELRLKNRKKTA